MVTNKWSDIKGLENFFQKLKVLCGGGCRGWGNFFLKKGLTLPGGWVTFVNARLRATRSTKRPEPRQFYSLKADIKHSPC